MNLKHLALTLSLGLMMAAAPAMAQKAKGQRADKAARAEKASPEKMAEEKTQKMVETLKLNKDQETKVRNLNASHAQEMKAFHDKMKAERHAMKASKEAGTPPTAEQKEKRRQMRTQMAEMRMNYDNALLDILTKDQYKQMKRQRLHEAEARREKMDVEGHGRGHGKKHHRREGSEF